MWILSMAGCFLAPGDATDPSEAPDPADPATPMDCGIRVDDVFPADGATEVFLNGYWDVPTVDGPGGIVYSLADGEGVLPVAFEERDGVWTADIGIADVFARDATVRLRATDADGCTQVLSTFTTGAYGRVDEDLYDGRVVQLILGGSDPFLVGAALGGELESGFLFAPVADDGGWAAVPVDSGAHDTCWATPVVPNARISSGTLFITSLDGVFAGQSDFTFAWQDLSIDALVNPATGHWDRVRVEGELRSTFDFCVIEPCVPCADDPSAFCRSVDDPEATGVAIAFPWTLVSGTPGVDLCESGA